MQLLSSRNLAILKTYISDTPLNTASVTPKKDFVILGGGQAAMDVTTTSARQGKFEARFYHKVFEDEIGRVRGHFGPLEARFYHKVSTDMHSIDLIRHILIMLLLRFSKTSAAAFVATSVPLTPLTFTPPVPHTPPVVRTDTSVSTTSTSHTSTSCTRSSGSKRGSKEGMW